MERKEPVKFQIYKHRLQLEDGQLITKQFIVLKYSDNTLRFTDFHKYVKSKAPVKPITDDGYTRFSFVVKMLNYAFFYAGVDSLNNLTVSVVKDFLNAYGTGTLPDDDENTTRTKSTVSRCVKYVMDFLEEVIADSGDECAMKSSQLYRYQDYRTNKGKVTKRKVPVFDVYYTGEGRAIYRDIPNKAFVMTTEYCLGLIHLMLGNLI